MLKIHKQHIRNEHVKDIIYISIINWIIHNFSNRFITEYILL
jgi:hypothetical protein